MLFSSLTIPRWLRRGIVPNDKGHTMSKYIYGGDTETVGGKPLTFQFFSADCGCSDLLWVTEDNAAETFLDWCARRRRKAEHVVYVHNLDFDLVELLYGQHHHLASPTGDFDFTVGRWKISGAYGSPTFCRVTNGHDITVLLVDSYSFVRGSLAYLADLFCPGLRKLSRPDGLGERHFTPRDADFVEYAMRDAEITYHVGRALEELHREFDLRQTVSVADMAARVFRHCYLDYTIPQPDDAIVQAALLAYHGGKNNMPVPPGWYLDVSSLDISSAYPHAMASFPSFARKDAYRRVTARGSKARLPDLGVYQVTGTVAECKWPSLYSHNFKPLAGHVEGVWVTGYELRESQESGEFRLAHATGYCYDAPAQDYERPALRAFVDEFYRRKSSEQDKVKRMMYKLILNSLSGKFIQTRKSRRAMVVDADDEDGRVTTAADLIAGGMFHPFIAALITGHTRARIHQLEHEYHAIHTATDGIFTQKRARPKGTGLGSLTCDAKGDLLLIRNKLYVLYGESGSQPSRVFKGKRIIKYAMHGFRGNVTDLERLVATSRRKYTAMHVNRLKESLRRNLQPNLFEPRDYVLKVGPLHVVPPKRRR